MKHICLAVLFIVIISDDIFAGDGPYVLQSFGRSPGRRSEFNRIQPGFFSQTEVEQAFGFGETTMPYSDRFFGVTTLAGYRFNSAVWTGFGTGIFDYRSGILSPLLLYGRYYFVNNPQLPFLTGDAGFLFHISGSEANTRIYANPGAGVVIAKIRRTAVTLGASLFTQWEGARRDCFLNFRIGLLIY